MENQNVFTTLAAAIDAAFEFAVSDGISYMVCAIDTRYAVYVYNADDTYVAMVTLYGEIEICGVIE